MVPSGRIEKINWLREHESAMRQEQGWYYRHLAFLMHLYRRYILGDIGSNLVAPDLPGYVLYRGSLPYGFDAHVRHYGNGDNMLRTLRLAQPSALKVGDVLATGERVLSESRGGYNGDVFIHLSGRIGGTWLPVPARIPLALLTEEDNAPHELWERSRRD